MPLNHYAEEYEHMLKTQGTWRPSNHSGEPVTETEDPHKPQPNLAPSLCTAVVSPLRKNVAQKLLRFQVRSLSSPRLGVDGLQSA